MRLSIACTLAHWIAGLRDRRGFTLIEVLVVVSVVALLLGLTVPAVQSAREAARRVQCSTHLRQIGAAMHAYHSIHDMFPPASLLAGGSKNWSRNELSQHSFLLPYLDQIALFNTINMDFADLEDPDYPLLVNRTARRTYVRTFLCPSDGEPNHLNSYRFNQGRVVAGRPTHDGPFSIGIHPGQQTFRDGLSQTAVVSERVGGTFVVGERNLRRNSKYPINVPGQRFPSDEAFIAYCLAAEPERWFHMNGRYWLYKGVANTNYNHNGPPNDLRPSCFGGIQRDGGLGGLSPPRSYHPGCVHVLFGDGHVDRVQDSIDARVWRALGTHDSGD